MTNNQLRILLSLRDEASIKLRKFDALTKRAVNEMRRHWLKLTVAVAAFTYAIVKTTKALIGVSAKFEKWQIQMEAFAASTSLAKEKLAELIDFSVRTPFTPEEVLSVSALLLPLEQAGHKLEDLLTMAGNIAAAYPMTFQEAALNLNKSLSAGMGAARLFYEQGVRAHMQQLSGIEDLTAASQEQVAKVFYDIYVDPSSPLSLGMKKLSKTYQGLISTIQGEFMLFKKAVGEKMFEGIKVDLINILLYITKNKEEGGKYRDVVEELSDFFSDAYENAKSLGVTTLVTGAEMVDIWNRVRIVFLQAQGGIETIAEKSMEAYLWALKLYSLGTINIFGKKHLDEVELSLAAVRAGMEKTAEAMIKIEERAEVDHSEKMKERIEKLKSFFEEQRAVIEEKEAELLELKTSSAETGEEEVQNKIISAQEKTVDKLRDLWQAWSDEKLSIEMGRLQGETEFYKLAIDTQKKANESMWVVVGKMKDTFAKSLSKTFVDMIKGVGSVKKSFEALGYKMIEILINFAVQRVINAAFGEMLLAAQTKASVAAAAKTTAAWKPAAVMVSLASFGQNAIPAAVGITAISGLLQALSIPSLEKGGIIPGSPSGTLVLAGEGNKSEAIIPLSKGGFGGQIINIEINNPIIDNDERIDELIEEVSYRLAQERR